MAEKGEFKEIERTIEEGGEVCCSGSSFCTGRICEECVWRTFERVSGECQVGFDGMFSFDLDQ